MLENIQTILQVYNFMENIKIFYNDIYLNFLILDFSLLMYFINRKKPQ